MANWQWPLSRSSLSHKYVVLCVICGSMSLLVGTSVLIIYALIRSHTTSIHYFETIPTYIPAIFLFANGLAIICLAKSTLRSAILLKLVGISYLVCALLSVVITVTTTIIHINRLQTHTTCIQLTDSSCSCFQEPERRSEELLPKSSDTAFIPTPMFVIHGVSNCQVIHGMLFSCLRALFGVSVLSILVCIFTLMLVYQLLSHQKKKRYLHQLELRRRFHLQNRGFGGHSSHPSYVSQHIRDERYVSPQIMANHNRNPSLRHMGYGYYDEPMPNGWAVPPHSYDNLDARLYNRSGDEDPQSGSGPNRCNSWTNWLSWSRSQVSTSNNHIPSQTNRRLFSFLRRNNRDGPNWMPQQNSFLPPHVFIPRIGSGGLTSLPPHLTRFYRDYNIRRNMFTSLNSSYRRTRSNEGIFQHMTSQNPDHSLFNSNANNTPNMFALWGPPPPYSCSQPQSLNRINTICNNIDHSSVGHRREASIHSTDVRPASKMSTPLSERRLRCSAFSSDGIRLNIEPNDNFLTPESKSSCIVEIHVPYNEDQNQTINDFEELRDSQKKSKLCFNTMPSAKRSEHLSAINPFKSLSNIPITLPNGFKFDNSPELSSSEFDSNKVETIRTAYRPHIFHNTSTTSSGSSPLNTTSNTTSELTSDLATYANTDEEFSESFPVDPPTDYKSTLIIQSLNTQSSPTDKSSSNVAERQTTNGNRMNSTQSMPNLSCIIPVSSSQTTSTRTQPNLWELHRIPSSGNTSTSQDFADYELDMDEESIKFMADLPNDTDLKNKPNDSYESSKSSSLTESLTPELIKPPTPFNNQEVSDETETTPSTATLSSLSESKPELIINIRGIQV